MKPGKIQKAAVSLLLCAASLRCVAQVSQLTMPEGTKIRVRLEQNLSSATAEEGQPVQLSVADDVRIGDTVVIKQGAAAVGTVTLATKKRRMGRTGKLDFSIDRVVAEDGSSIPLRYSPQKRDGGSHALATGIITAGAAVAFWPAAPFVLLIQGKDVTLHRGMEIDVFTDQTFAMRNPAALLASAGQSLSATPVAVQVTSQPEGAEIEVDGTFVGSTPGTIQVIPGLHHISVKRGRSSWQRDMDVRAGSLVPVNATLK
jgi:PEGA domain